MRPPRHPRRTLFVLTLIALACTGGTFTCSGHSGGVSATSHFE